MKINLKDCVIRCCDESDVQAILELQESVFSTLDDERLLRRNTEEMFIHCTQSPNFTFGVYNQASLIALAITVDERNTPEDLTNDLKCCHPIKGANLKLVLVRKEYRGNGLQRMLMQICEQHMVRLGYTHLCATVSPYNEYSRANMLALGYQFDHSALKYGGLEREVFVRRLIH